MNIDVGRAIHLLRFSGSDMKISWHIQKVVADSIDDNTASLIAMDTSNRREFYLFGKMRMPGGVASSSASVGLRVNKLDGKILHQLHFENMDEFGGYVHPDNSN